MHLGVRHSPVLSRPSDRNSHSEEGARLSFLDKGDPRLCPQQPPVRAAEAGMCRNASGGCRPAPVTPADTHRHSHSHKCDLLLETECLPVCERVLPSLGTALLYTVHLQDWDVKRL